MYKTTVRTRHKTHFPLREKLQKLPFRSLVRLGSSTTLEEYNRERVRKGLRQLTSIIECNTVDAVKTSANKLLMKEAFKRGGVKTADWWTTTNGQAFYSQNELNRQPVNITELQYPIVAKHIYGSRGTGNTLLYTQQELTAFLNGKTLGNYIFEKFYSYSREYRLHVDSEGCFYTCRKMLKEDTPENQRWYRNDSNSVWIMENNQSFDKPTNWNDLVTECVKALKSVGLDVGAIDVKIQSRDKRNPEFIILETNSAPSFGDVTLEKYTERLPIILKRKHANQ